MVLGFKCCHVFGTWDPGPEIASSSVENYLGEIFEVPAIPFPFQWRLIGSFPRNCNGPTLSIVQHCSDKNVPLDQGRRCIGGAIIQIISWENPPIFWNLHGKKWLGNFNQCVASLPYADNQPIVDASSSLWSTRILFNIRIAESLNLTRNKKICVVSAQLTAVVLKKENQRLSHPTPLLESRYY